MLGGVGYVWQACLLLCGCETLASLALSALHLGQCEREALMDSRRLLLGGQEEMGTLMMLQLQPAGSQGSHLKTHQLSFFW